MIEEPTPFQEYDVAGVGTVIDPQGEPGYRVRLPDGQVTAYPATSGNPSQANAAADIAYAIGHPAPAHVPLEVPVWRVKAVAKLAGLESAINAVLAALPEPNRTVAAAVWNEGNVILRNSATVTGLAAALGLSAAQVDELFRQAVAFEV